MLAKGVFIAMLCFVGSDATGDCSESPDTCASPRDDTALLQKKVKVSPARDGIAFDGPPISIGSTDQDSSFDLSKLQIGSSQSDYGGGAQILVSKDIFACQGASAVVAVAKQTEFILSKDAGEPQHVSFGDPLYCKSRLSSAGHVPTDGCADAKTLKQVYSYFQNDGVLSRIFDSDKYDDMIFNSPGCHSKAADFRSSYSIGPTPKYQILDLRSKTVGYLKSLLFSGPVVAYIHNEVKDAAVDGMVSFSDHDYNPHNDQDSVTAVLLTGWGVTGTSLFWRALTPWGSKAGNFGVINLVQPSTMNIAFFKFIGVAAASSGSSGGKGRGGGHA